MCFHPALDEHQTAVSHSWSGKVSETRGSPFATSNYEEKLASDALLVSDRIEKRIYYLRKQRVMLSMDLAELYGVEPKVLVQAVKRNIERFPDDFIFQLRDRKSTRLNSSHEWISYAVFC